MGQCMGGAPRERYQTNNEAAFVAAGGARGGGGGGYDAPAPRMSAADKKRQMAIELGMPADDDAAAVGCYLVFDSASGGVLNAQWSETFVDGAWAFFFPRKKVPSFKFKQNGGRTELIRGLAVNKQKQFNGWGQFVKLAYDMDGVLQIYSREDSQADFWFQNSRQMVSQLHTDEWLEAKDISCVAIIPRHNQCFVGIQTVPESQFIDTAKGALGYAWKPL